MTNEELKKKIVEIIRYCYVNEKDYGYIFDLHIEEKINAIADALIAAGIGDVKDVEAEANRYEMLYKLQNRDMALAERRAHDAEHRAEVAERALKIVAYEIPCDDWCPFSQKCNVELNGENWYQCCFDEYLRQAEKELAEEKR